MQQEIEIIDSIISTCSTEIQNLHEEFILIQSGSPIEKDGDMADLFERKGDDPTNDLFRKRR